MSLFSDAERSPITVILCIGAIAATLAPETGRSIDHFILSPLVALDEPWRFITSVFPHAGAMHLLFNLFWIWQLGRVIEERLGLERMLGFTLIAAVASCGAEVIFWNSPVGLSGVVYALATFAWARGRHDKRYAGIIDRSTRHMLIAWFFLCIFMTEAGLMRVANGAHGGGALIGYLVGQRRRWPAPAYLAVLGALVFVRLGDKLPGAPAHVLSHQALEALKSGENEEAARLYLRSFQTGSVSAGSMYNYGLAELRMGHTRAAMNALITASEMDPQVIQNVELRARVLAAKAAKDSAD